MQKFKGPLFEHLHCYKMKTELLFIDTLTSVATIALSGIIAYFYKEAAYLCCAIILIQVARQIIDLPGRAAKYAYRMAELDIELTPKPPAD